MVNAQNLWTIHNPKINSNTLKCIAYGNSNYVAIGDSGTILTSTDLVNWSKQSSNTTSNLIEIIWEDSQFIAIGDQGTIITSNNGKTWRVVKLNARKLTSIAWGNNRFVVLDDGGSSAVSEDGVNWSLRMVDSTAYLWASAAMMFHQNQFIAVTNYGMVFRSTDGIKWTYKTINHSYSFAAVTWGNGKYVAIGYGSGLPVLASSVDGIDWIVDTTMFKFHDWPATIQWANGKFKVLTHYDIECKTNIYTSSDAINWVSNQSNFQLNSISEVNGISFGFTNSGILSGNNYDSLKYSTEFTGRLISTMKTDSSITAISTEGELITSKDGASWLRHNSQSVLLPIPSITCVFKKRLFAIPYRSRGMLYELTDFFEWQSRDFESNPSVEPHLLATDGSRIVAIGWDWDSSKPVAMTSTDGVSWAKYQIGPLNPTSIVWGNNHFIVYGDSAYQPVIKVSPDGSQWYSAGSKSEMPLSAIVWNGNIFVSVGTITIKPSSHLSYQFGRILTSSDGLSWTVNPTDVKPLNQVFWLNNQFIAVGNGGSIYTSKDGQNWSNEGTGLSSDLYAASWFNNKLLIFGTNGFIASRPSVSSIKFSNSNPKPHFPIVIADQHINYLVTSPGNVAVKLFDLRGRLMQTLINRRHSEGSYNLSLPQNAIGKCCVLMVYLDDHAETIRVLPVK
jgi:hypothetical protein